MDAHDLEDVISIGRALTEEDMKTFPDGACCSLDYRSLIHGKIHESYKLGERRLTGFDYDRFFAATDTLLDVGNILHMAQISEWPTNEILGQLWMYGVLQSLAVQQQAARQLLKCFSHQELLAGEQEIDEVNEYRIAVAGHPSDHTRTKRQIKGCSFLGHRAFGSRTRFTFVTCEDFDKWHHREVDPLGLIDLQKSAIELNFALVWKQIKDDPKYHENQSVENVL